MLKTAAKVIKIVEKTLARAAFFEERPIFAIDMRQIDHYRILFALFIASFMWGCKTTQEATEDEAFFMLDQARELLADGQFNAARDTILALRHQYPTALQTRRAAILTLDSVELLETRDSLSRYAISLEAAREEFKRMKPRVNCRTNDAYYQQQRRVFEMDQHYDELCAKAKFYVRKIDIDRRDL